MKSNTIIGITIIVLGIGGGIGYAAYLYGLNDQEAWVARQTAAQQVGIDSKYFKAMSHDERVDWIKKTYGDDKYWQYSVAYLGLSRPLQDRTNVMFAVGFGLPIAGAVIGTAFASGMFAKQTQEAKP